MRPEEKLVSAGLKVTAPRVQVLALFIGDAQAHLTAEAVYLRMMDTGTHVARSTVYRVLTMLTEAGLLTRNSFVSTTAVYQLSKARQRDHLVCIACSEIIDFEDDLVDKRLQEIVQRAGYSVVNRPLTVHGLCAKCRAASADVRSARRGKA